MLLAQSDVRRDRSQVFFGTAEPAKAPMERIKIHTRDMLAHRWADQGSESPLRPFLFNKDFLATPYCCKGRSSMGTATVTDYSKGISEHGRG